jgi:hypothetical protein
VLKAWLLQVRYKLLNKTRFHCAFSMMKAIVYVKAQGNYEQRLAAVHEGVRKFKECFRDEQPLVQYFEQHWMPKIGVLSSELTP